MSLKAKTALLFCLLLLAALGGFTTILLWGEGRALADGQAREQEKLVGGLTEVCRGAFFSDQELPLMNYMRRLSALPEVVEAACAGVDGKLAAHTAPERIGGRADGFLAERLSAPRGGAGLASRTDGDRLEMVAPVTLKDAPVGAAEIVFDKRPLEKRLREDLAAARRRILRFSLPVLLAGFAAAFLLTGRLIEPLADLVSAARAVGGGRLDHVVSVERNDEIGALAGEFNRMAGRLKELDRMKQDFVSSITHDLKSPLTAINASTALCEKEADRLDPGGARTAGLREALGLIRRRSEGLKNLVTSILEVARIETGLVLNRRPVDLEEVAERVVDAHRPAAAEKGLSLDLVVESALPRLSLDEDKLERAAANLVGNAVKFTARGGVLVRTGLREGHAFLQVSDTGPGIPPEFRTRLFTKFSRSDHPDTAGREGTGLGLSIAKGIAQAHGGDITIEDEPGGGARFTMTFPLERPS